jgi:hypothetical protein
MAKIRYVGEAVVVVPVGGGLAVAHGQVVDVPNDIARRLVAGPAFTRVPRQRKARVVPASSSGARVPPNPQE